MKRIFCAALMATVLATPAFAAKLYLKDGGVIEAKRVWKGDGRINVLANRDTLTSFAPSEVDLKKTFPKARKHKKKRVVRKKIAAAKPAAAATQQKPGKPAPVSNVAPAPAKPAGTTVRTPESLLPKSKTVNTIQQRKKEMAGE
jgi:hypothetical protein